MGFIAPSCGYRILRISRRKFTLAVATSVLSKAMFLSTADALNLYSPDLISSKING
jgi:hypothetical protein